MSGFQALVLVGGEGTRLRPLTLTRPKPALPLVDRPFIRFMVDWLAAHGVDEVIMACGFRAEELRAALGDEVPGGPAIRYLEEPEPLGTAGPLRLAADAGMLRERFVVANGDVLCDLDLSAHLRSHAERGALASLALYPVADPSSYGLVRRTAAGAVTGFLEKPDPSEIDTDEVNAGCYVLERAVVDEIPAGRAVSIEREIFPRLVGRGLYGTRLDGYWMDIGTPERYLQASWDILEGTVDTQVASRVDAAGFALDGAAGIAGDAVLHPPALVEAGVRVGAGASVGPRAVLGVDCRLGADARVEGSVLHPRCTVRAGASVSGSILAADVDVGEGAVVDGAVIGERAQVRAGTRTGLEARLDPGEVLA